MRGTESSTAYRVARFEKDSILFSEKDTSRLFRFVERPQKPLRIWSFSDAEGVLVHPIQTSEGLLYPKQDFNLRQHLETRARAYNPVPYSEEEIQNTFHPILLAISKLHQNSIYHGALCPEAIQVHSGQIKLVDWFQFSSGSLSARKVNPEEVQKNKRVYYDSECVSAGQDWKAMGLILAECCLLEPSQRLAQKPPLELVRSIYWKGLYSRKFTIGILVLTLGLSHHFSKIPTLFSPQEQIIDGQVADVILLFQHLTEKSLHIMSSSIHSTPVVNPVLTFRRSTPGLETVQSIPKRAGHARKNAFHHLGQLPLPLKQENSENTRGLKLDKFRSKDELFKVQALRRTHNQEKGSKT